MIYKIPDRTTFYRFAERLGPDKIAEIFAVMVVRLMQAGIIKGEKVSLDSSIIWAWFKDCRFANKPDHDNRWCRGHKKRVRDASWTWDNHREEFVFGYRVHIAIDSLSGLPIMPTVTKAGYGDAKRTVPWFVKMISKRLCLRVKKFMADAGYDGYTVRRLVIKRLKAIPFITLNPRNCKASRRMRSISDGSCRGGGVSTEQEALQEEVPAEELTETTVSTIKRRFNDPLYSKKRRGQKSELRLKVLTYNLSIIARLTAHSVMCQRRALSFRLRD